MSTKLQEQLTVSDLSARPSARGRNMMELFVVYQDSPERYSLWRFFCGVRDEVPLAIEKTLDEARLAVPNRRAKDNAGRMHGDSPLIAECWI
jgi:hypothetical protein